MSNHYNRNCATFNPTDELVLNDGVLWDVRCTRPIYKFDQFQNNISGIFHPLGLEIIISSEIVSFVFMVILSPRTVSYKSSHYLVAFSIHFQTIQTVFKLQVIHLDKFIH